MCEEKELLETATTRVRIYPMVYPSKRVLETRICSQFMDLVLDLHWTWLLWSSYNSLFLCNVWKVNTYSIRIVVIDFCS